MMKNDYKIKVDVNIKASGEIEILTTGMGYDFPRQIMLTQEMAVKQALIALNWTPPDREKWMPVQEFDYSYTGHVDLITKSGFRVTDCRWNPDYNTGYVEDGPGFWEERESGTHDKYTAIGPDGLGGDDDFLFFMFPPQPPETIFLQFT